MLESFWGYCERVQEQTTEVNISGNFVFPTSSLPPLEHRGMNMWYFTGDLRAPGTPNPPSVQSHTDWHNNESLSLFCPPPPFLCPFCVFHFLWKYYLQWRSTSGKGRREKNTWLVHTSLMDGFWNRPCCKWVGGKDERCIVAQVSIAKGSVPLCLRK